jgi:hypothetical protein
LTGRPPKRQVHIVLDEDDYLWARLHGFEFSDRFSEYLKQIRREVEVASYGLIVKRSPRSEKPADDSGAG